MNLNSDTQSKTNIVTQSLHLNALDPEKLAAYYRDVIGLTILEHDDDNAHYALGTEAGETLLEISQASSPSSRSSAGLYHLALRLPTEEDLATLLRHLAQYEALDFTGASDHGYSHALYLNDPEGNGIEIYRDKPESEWDVRDDGEIGGIVERLDLDKLIQLAKPEFEGVPEGSDLGHMHLHVGDIEETWAFYRDYLGLGNKFTMGGRAVFMATGQYHHHLGANTWKGTGLDAPDEGEQGLRSYTWKASEEDLNWIKGRLADGKIDYREDEQAIAFKDNSGITVNIVV